MLQTGGKRDEIPVFLFSDSENVSNSMKHTSMEEAMHHPPKYLTLLATLHCLDNKRSCICSFLLLQSIVCVRLLFQQPHILSFCPQHKLERSYSQFSTFVISRTRWETKRFFLTDCCAHRNDRGSLSSPNKTIVD